jgi:hypothetical protein
VEPIDNRRTETQSRIADEFANYPEFWILPKSKAGRENKRVRIIKEICERVGCTRATIQSFIMIEEMKRLGEKVREKERKAKRNALAKFEDDSFALGPAFARFEGWDQFFTKLKMLVEMFKGIARSRGEVWAKASLENISDQCERALEREARQREMERERAKLSGERDDSHTLPSFAISIDKP